MNIVLSIEEASASSRIEAVSTDNWSVTIFNADDDSEVVNFTPFVDAPAEIQLPTGEYYIEAHSNNFAEAEFENPYYSGRSANFTIDKEELKTIDIDAKLANSKVAINYSANVINTFHEYTGTVTVVSSGAFLFYDQGENREGYFVAEPLSVVVDLSYTKLDGTFITRQFTANIDAQPKTLYNINVDASLEDGKIVININVDESFDEIQIDLGDNTSSDANTFLTFIDEAPNEVLLWVIETSDNGYLAGGRKIDGDLVSLQVVKLDEDGNVIWSTLQSLRSSVGGFETDEGDYIIGGNSYQSLIAFKLNSEGNLLWERPINIDGGISDFSPMNDGGALLCGSTSDQDMFVGRLDQNGLLTWSDEFVGSSGDNAFEVVQTDDNGFAMIGASNSNDGDFLSNNNSTVWVFKFDSENSLQWKENIGDQTDEQVYDIVQLSNGNLAILGSTRELNDPNEEASLTVLDIAGNTIWSQDYGEQFQDRASSLIQNNAGEIVFVGEQYTDFEYPIDLWLVKVSPLNGHVISEFNYPGSKNPFDLIQSRDNGYVIVGQSYENGINSFVFKVDQDGNQ